MLESAFDAFVFENTNEARVDATDTLEKGIINTGDKAMVPPETPGTTSAAPIAIPFRKLVK